MQAWIYRARDLDIISEATFNRLFREFGRRGWRETEPGDQLPSEQPQRMKRLVLRALAKNVISAVRCTSTVRCTYGSHT